MEIYNENEQAEMSKLQNVKLVEKKRTRKWNGAKTSVTGDKWNKKRNKGNGDIRAKFIQVHSQLLQRNYRKT